MINIRYPLSSHPSIPWTSCCSLVGNHSYGCWTGIYTLTSLYFTMYLFSTQGKSTAIAWNCQIPKECISSYYVESVHWLYTKTNYKSVVPWLQAVVNFSLLEDIEYVYHIHNFFPIYFNSYILGKIKNLEIVQEYF